MADPTENEASAQPFRIKRLMAGINQLFTIEGGELRAFFWSFTYFFALLCGYYIIRPMRDEMGIAGGVQHLQWLFSGTLVLMLAAVPLFGWVTRRFAPRQFLPYVYYFFIGNLLLFFALFQSNLTHAYVARAFFMWASVFNLFIVSVFWSFMADIFTNAQAKRLFGMIAAGGTAGALTGPALTAGLALHLGPTQLLLLSAAFLGWSVLCIHRLIAWRESSGVQQSAPGGASGKIGAGFSDKAMGGDLLAGVRLVARSPYLIGICLFMLLFTTLSTILYFQQAHIVRDRFDDPAARTAVFAAMDFGVNALAILIQLFLTGRMVKKLGLGRTLASIPLLLAAGLLALGVAGTLGVIAVVQIVRRAGDYAITRPAREMLYVVVTKEEKYKAKNLIDTVVYRGGDAISAWVYAGLQALGLSAGSICLAALPLAGAWAWIALRLGKSQEQLALRTNKN
jgi:AAA family ATP:ADP antiporter